MCVMCGVWDGVWRVWCLTLTASQNFRHLACRVHTCDAENAENSREQQKQQKSKTTHIQHTTHNTHTHTSFEHDHHAVDGTEVLAHVVQQLNSYRGV